MQHVVRRSLLVQLLSVYLLFVLVVLIGGLGVNTVVEQRIRSDTLASEQALAQEIALQTHLQLRDDEHVLSSLSHLMAQSSKPNAIGNTFQAIQKTSSDIDQLYWLDPFGYLLVSWPTIPGGIEAEFSPTDIIQQARISDSPVFEVGIAAETTPSAGVIMAQSVHVGGKLIGIVAANFTLDELSDPLENVVQAQQRQGRQLQISIIDNRGELIASSQQGQVLWTVLDQLPGAEVALQGHITSQVGIGTDGQDWLFSAVPVPTSGWAVVVQKPMSEALAVVTQLHFWLLTVAVIFAVGGLLFWLILLGRVISPLHILANQHQALPESELAFSKETALLARRNDEVGRLAGSLVRLERDGLAKLGEQQTLLETSNEVVRSLDPHSVVRKIIREVRRLVDVQAAAVLLPDEQQVLHVLVSEGHSTHYDQTLALPPENIYSSAVLALRDGKPVQKLLSPEPNMAALSYDEGFRSVLAIPIISRHAGGVVLLVHRTRPRLFNQHEIDLLLTFANYAMLAWEHAVLYERSDERLREVAQENAELYSQASEEKQKLQAIMESMSDGLVLTGTDGSVLYANQGTCTITGLPGEALEHRHIHVLYDALRQIADDPTDYERFLVRLQSASITEWILALKRDDQRRVVHLRLFDVQDEAGRLIGRGLLLRDVTRERELDEFKSALLAAVGHELRTPLAAIKGFASTLLQQDVSWSYDDQRHFLLTISSEADRLAQLVSNLLDLSRQEAGLLLLNRTPTSIQELVAKTVERINLSEVTISTSIPDDLPLLDVDRARIEVVLHNLLINAMTYGDGEVSISARQQENTIRIEVFNNGPGIPEEELPHVFERFYRSGGARKRHSSGTGLGLTICKAFIEAHGGIIRATNCVHGTTFSFSLPLTVSTVPTSPLRMVEVGNVTDM
jgi:PAS domain S-box-containing protein